jgi:hypothetical protein
MLVPEPAVELDDDGAVQGVVVAVGGQPRRVGHVVHGRQSAVGDHTGLAGGHPSVVVGEGRHRRVGEMLATHLRLGFP